VPRQQHHYGLNHLHFLTTSPYRRARLFDSERFKQNFISTLAELRSEQLAQTSLLRSAAFR
jgi:hypothetical protein